MVPDGGVPMHLGEATQHQVPLLTPGFDGLPDHLLDLGFLLLHLAVKDKETPLARNQLKTRELCPSKHLKLDKIQVS